MTHIMEKMGNGDDLMEVASELNMALLEQLGAESLEELRDRMIVKIVGEDEYEDMDPEDARLLAIERVVECMMEIM